MKTSWLTGLLAIGFILAGCNETGAQAEDPGLWQTDFDKALERAAAENKYVFVNFSGLPWCGWCKALDAEVLSKPAFIDYAKENLVCVLLNYSGSGKPTAVEFAARHEALLERYKINAFPTVLILNPQGLAIERDGYRPGGAQPYVEFIKSVIAADRGTRGAKE